MLCEALTTTTGVIQTTSSPFSQSHQVNHVLLLNIIRLEESCWNANLILSFSYLNPSVSPYSHENKIHLIPCIIALSLSFCLPWVFTTQNNFWFLICLLLKADVHVVICLECSPCHKHSSSISLDIVSWAGLPHPVSLLINAPQVIIYKGCLHQAPLHRAWRSWERVSQMSQGHNQPLLFLWAESQQHKSKVAST